MERAPINTVALHLASDFEGHASVDVATYTNNIQQYKSVPCTCYYNDART